MGKTVKSVYVPVSSGVDMPASVCLSVVSMALGSSFPGMVHNMPKSVGVLDSVPSAQCTKKNW